jgi:hypothetical protein
VLYREQQDLRNRHGVALPLSWRNFPVGSTLTPYPFFDLLQIVAQGMRDAFEGAT